MDQLLGAISELHDLDRNNPRRQPLYTLPQIFGKQHDENFVSDWLAYLLNPSVNGLGFAPLSMLCRHFNKDIDGQDVTITREYAFENGRRIDLLISIGKKLLIGVENKIRSWETDSQTIEYSDSINEMRMQEGYDDVLLIYLKPDRNESLPESKDFHVLIYSDLISVLREIPFDILRDARKNFYLYEFILFAEDYLMTENKSITLTPTVKAYIKNRAVIEAARKEFIIYANEFDQRLADDILLQSAFGDGYEIKCASTYIQFYKPEWDLFHFHFELMNYATGKRTCEVDSADDIRVVIHQEGTKYKASFTEFVREKCGVNTLPSTKMSLRFASGDKDDYEESVKDISDILKSPEYAQYIDLADTFYFHYCKQI